MVAIFATNIFKKMSDTIENKVISTIKKSKRGRLFFTEDFLHIGNAKAISKALQRLNDKNEIVRIARGIYTRPRIDTIIGEVRPGAEEIAKAIAKRDKARIIPTGVWALNALGLSTQVPMNVVYLTDGAARKIDLGKRKITFKKTAPKNLAHVGEISGLMVQAIKEIGKGMVTEDEMRKIIQLLKKEDPYKLKHDIRLAPEWIRIIMRKALSTND